MYSRQELIALIRTKALKFGDFTPPEEQERLAKSRDDVFQFGHLSGELTIVRKDGMRREIEYRTVANVLPGYHATFMHDITGRKEAEEIVEAARQQAESANHAKSDFLSRMSHELRTPLNAILGFGQLLEMEQLSKNQLSSVAHILSGGRHLLDLINEVLDISRIEAGRLDLSIEPVDLHDLLVELMTLVAPLATGQSIRIVNGMIEAARIH